jgi:hypothetical protein
MLNAHFKRVEQQFQLPVDIYPVRIPIEQAKEFSDLSLHDGARFHHQPTAGEGPPALPDGPLRDLDPGKPLTLYRHPS